MIWSSIYVLHLLPGPQVALGSLCRHGSDELHAPPVLAAVEGVVSRYGDGETFVVSQIGRQKLSFSCAAFYLLFVVENEVV